MEKKKEKSYLISQLYDYLEEQIQLLKADRHQLNRKMHEIVQEKNEKEGEKLQEEELIAPEALVSKEPISTETPEVIGEYLKTIIK